MASQTEKEILAILPWTNPVPKYSYAGIAVFDVGKYYIIAPLKKEEIYMNYCMTRAITVGNKKVEEGKWNSYNIEYKSRSIKKWPHIILKGKNR